MMSPSNTAGIAIGVTAGVLLFLAMCVTAVLALSFVIFKKIKNFPGQAVKGKKQSLLGGVPTVTHDGDVPSTLVGGASTGLGVAGSSGRTYTPRFVSELHKESLDKYNMINETKASIELTKEVIAKCEGYVAKYQKEYDDLVKKKEFLLKAPEKIALAEEEIRKASVQFIRGHYYDPEYRGNGKLPVHPCLVFEYGLRSLLPGSGGYKSHVGEFIKHSNILSKYGEPYKKVTIKVLNIVCERVSDSLRFFSNRSRDVRREYYFLKHVYCAAPTAVIGEIDKLLKEEGVDDQQSQKFLKDFKIFYCEELNDSKKLECDLRNRGCEFKDGREDLKTFLNDLDKIYHTLATNCSAIDRLEKEKEEIKKEVHDQLEISSTVISQFGIKIDSAKESLEQHQDNLSKHEAKLSKHEAELSKQEVELKDINNEIICGNKYLASQSSR